MVLLIKLAEDKLNKKNELRSLQKKKNKILTIYAREENHSIMNEMTIDDCKIQ